VDCSPAGFARAGIRTGGVAACGAKEEHMELPPMTQSLARRIQRVVASLHIAGMTLVRDLPGNPFGVHVVRFGPATALLAATAPDSPGWWNRVTELDDAADDATLDATLALYRSYRLRAHLDLTPATLTERLSGRLVTRGAAPADCGAISYGLPAVVDAGLPPGVVVREIGNAEADAFAGLWAAGFEVTDPDHREASTRIRAGWFRMPENRLYVADVDGEPAGIAARYVSDGMGFLNVGATLPAHRGRGLHAALTARRIADAARVGCELVISETGYGTISHVHMQRAGMCLAYNDLVWRDQPRPVP